MVKKQKFSVGEKVFLIHLQEEAVVKRIEHEDLLYVESDGIEIPVFSTDVSKEIPVKNTEGESRKSPETTPFNKPRAEKEESKGDSGIYVGFEPLPYPGEISSFKIYLINASEESIEFEYFFLLRNQVEYALKNIAGSYQYVLLHEIEYDMLNEAPHIEIKVSGTTNPDFTGKLDQKIRAQNFFNKIALSPLINKELYLYRVQTTVVQRKKEKQTPGVSFDPEVLKQMMMDVPIEKDNDVSAPVEEIDLHIEMLVKDHGELGAGEKLQLQLRHFQQALERALSHHARKLFVIHGVGSGKLRTEIHKMLKDYPHVTGYSNDYHPRYGFGATEITFY